MFTVVGRRTAGQACAGGVNFRTLLSPEYQGEETFEAFA